MTRAPHPRSAAVAATLALLAAGCSGSGFGVAELGSRGGAGNPALPVVVYLTSSPAEALPPEEAAALAWLRGEAGFNVQDLQMIDLPGATLPRDAVLWWHYAAEEALPSVAARPATLRAVRDHLRDGGSALLTLIAASYVVPLGVESSPLDVVSTHARLDPFDATLGGLQPRPAHPMLRELGGGVYTAADRVATPRPAAVYGADRGPREGRVWALHKSERGVDPSFKVGIEYPGSPATGGGIVTVGAHLHFAAADNRNRPQLEAFVRQALGYLSGRGSAPAAATVVPVATRDAGVEPEEAYWEPPAVDFARTDLQPGPLPPIADPDTLLNTIARERSAAEVVRYPDADVPFTLAAPRGLLIGSQLGRIDLFRVHPAAVLRNLRFGIVRPDRGITWLDDPDSGGQRTFYARPEGIELHYFDGELSVRLHLTVDRRYPALVGVLALRGPAAVDVIATWEAQIPAPATRGSAAPRIGWDEGAQAVGWEIPGRFAAKGGFGRPTQTHFLGFQPAVALDTVASAAADSAPLSGLPAAPTSPGSVALQVHVEPGRPSVLPIVVVGGPTREVDVDAAFTELVAAPGRVWEDNADHFRAFAERTLNLQVPAPAFQNGFRWAKVGIESLRTVIPGLGTGIAAGFGAADADDAWIARPHAFGGGALWAAMAADAYGDRATAAATLRLLARFQGIDGRLPSTITADAGAFADRIADTSLFLVALDNHFRTWNDAELLRELWPAVPRALDHLIAADADGDGLVDGFSRLDRWSDDPEVLTTIDQAGLWGAAVAATQRMAEHLGDGATASRAAAASTPIRTALNDAFWNPEQRGFNFAKRRDGTYVDVPTVLPAVPMIFSLLDTGIAIPALDSFSGAGLASDWGVVLRERRAPPDPGLDPPPPLVPPRGAPTVAADRASPLFTGWAALAEYANQRPVAGFDHAYTNLLLLDQANAGYATAAFARDRLAARTGIVQAAAAQGLVVLPVIRGMLGIRPDAPNGSVSITPQLPAGWARVIVDRVRVGGSEFRLALRRSADRTTFEFDRWRGNRDLLLDLGIHVPSEVAVAAETEIIGAELVGEPLVEDRPPAGRVARLIVRPVADEVAVSIRHDPFPQLMSPIPGAIAEARAWLQTGATSRNPRIVRSRYLGGLMSIRLEGLPGRRYTLSLASPWRIAQVTGLPNIEPVYPEPGTVAFDVTIPGSGNRYRAVDLEVSFER